MSSLAFPVNVNPAEPKPVDSTTEGFGRVTLPESPIVTPVRLLPKKAKDGRSTGLFWIVASNPVQELALLTVMMFAWLKIFPDGLIIRLLPETIKAEVRTLSPEQFPPVPLPTAGPRVEQVPEFSTARRMFRSRLQSMVCTLNFALRFPLYDEPAPYVGNQDAVFPLLVRFIEKPIFKDGL